MYTLGIETSCDETCASVVRNSSEVLSSVVSSSLARHACYGGVIPEIASRAHLESICSVVEAALEKAKITPKNLDLIAVTQGPGLIGSLLVGISFARSLSLGWNLPLLGVNHLRAHLYAAFIEKRVTFPFIGLVVSGGHTSLYKVDGLSGEQILGATRDDAAGEAFDKVAKILGLGYPGGPIIEELAKKGNSNAFKFRCDCGSGLDFSFSGIKTAVLYKYKELKRIYGRVSQGEIADICASFQEAVVSDLVKKAMRALKSQSSKTLVVGGGVAFNNRLRQKLHSAALGSKIKLFIANRSYCLDNAAMVASFAARLFASGVHRSHAKLDSLMA